MSVLSRALTIAGAGLSYLLRGIDLVVAGLGWTIAWLLVAMVVGQFALVLLRYVFGVGFIMGQEAVVFAHGTVFMVLAALALQADQHVRVDVFYRRLNARGRALVDVLGLVVFLLPLCGLILLVGWPYVETSWAIQERSRETAGLPFVYIHKTMVIVFAGLLGLQGLAMLVRKLTVLFGLPAIR